VASRARDGAALVEAAGWLLVRRTGRLHLLWHCPCGQHSLTTPSTPSAEFINSLVSKIRRCPQSVRP
jgi:hypothetical protein